MTRYDFDVIGDAPKLHPRPPAAEPAPKPDPGQPAEKPAIQRQPAPREDAA
ncbi:hypothetical protein [Dongia sp.]|uniref:hypothetical protein n=1 Tax=Dongia sp. TaxID=1977262 RepID=UPI0035AFB065